MNNEIIKEYEDYMGKIGNRKSLYKAVTKAFTIKSAIYPGSHIDITPSLVIPKVTYIDNFKGAIKFFQSLETIEAYINDNKDYSEAHEISFLGEDYQNSLVIDQVDLIISQYAGFVGQATKAYLKIGGILLCNDSHGDATLAKFDEDYEFIGIINSNNQIQNNDLEDYFKLPKDKPIDLNFVRQKMKGLKYKSTAQNYLFRKTK